MVYGQEVLLTVRDKGSDAAGHPSYNVGRSKRKASSDTFNCEKDEEAGRELHQSRDEEVHVDISS